MQVNEHTTWRAIQRIAAQRYPAPPPDAKPAPLTAEQWRAILERLRQSLATS